MVSRVEPKLNFHHTIKRYFPPYFLHAPPLSLELYSESLPLRKSIRTKEREGERERDSCSQQLSHRKEQILCNMISQGPHRREGSWTKRACSNPEIKDCYRCILVVGRACASYYSYIIFSMPHPIYWWIGTRKGKQKDIQKFT